MHLKTIDNIYDDAEHASVDDTKMVRNIKMIMVMFYCNNYGGDYDDDDEDSDDCSAYNYDAVGDGGCGGGYDKTKFESHKIAFEMSYGKHDFTLMVISYEIYQTPKASLII